MPGRRFRIFSREFKEAAVRRILAGEKIRTVANELRLRPQLLYTWLDYYEQGGADTLVPRGRPPGRPPPQGGVGGGGRARGARAPTARGGAPPPGENRRGWVMCPGPPGPPTATTATVA